VLGVLLGDDELPDVLPLDVLLLLGDELLGVLDDGVLLDGVLVDGIDVPVTVRKEPAGTFWPWFGVLIRKIVALA
jgi:hypothetical protein